MTSYEFLYFRYFFFACCSSLLLFELACCRPGSLISVCAARRPYMYIRIVSMYLVNYFDVVVVVVVVEYAAALSAARSAAHSRSYTLNTFTFIF